MKLLIKIIITFSIIAGCNHDEISDEQRKSETEKIRTRIETFTAAYEKKDMNALIALLSSSNSFYFLGSDVAEKNFNISDFRNQIDHDWELFDSINFGQIRNESIIIADSDDLAVAIYEIPVLSKVGNSHSKFVMRMTNTFVKENGVWQLIQGMVAIPSVGESSAELIKMKKDVINAN